MKKFIQSLLVTGTAFFAPIAVFAQQFGSSSIATGTNATNLIGSITAVLNQIVPVLITLAVIYFVWGVLQYTILAKTEEAKTEGRAKMINGFIGLFVILAMWGIIGLISSSLGLGLGGEITTTQMPGVVQ